MLHVPADFQRYFRQSPVSDSLSVDYLGSAKVGDTMMIESHVVRLGTSISCCQALGKRGDAIIARANANFSVRIADAGSA